MVSELVSRVSNVELESYDPGRHSQLLERWIRGGHVARWWGPSHQHQAALEQRSPDTHGVILADGKPVGYICWQHPLREELEAAGLVDLPEDLVDIDILIGEPGYLGCGIGPQALILLLSRLRSEGVGVAGIATSVLNTVAIRAFEKAGFKAYRDFEEPDGWYRYMVARL